MCFKIVLFELFLFVLTFAQNWDSPCPLQFNYDRITNDSWSGILRFNVKEELKGVRIDITLESNPIEITSEFGEVQYQKTSRFGISEYSIVNTTARILPDVHFATRITATYKPDGFIPYLREFKVNFKRLCSRSHDVKSETIDRSHLGVSGLALQGSFESPCPDGFRYDTTKPGEWTGTLILTTDEKLNGFWIRLTFDLHPITVETDLGIIDYRKNEIGNAADYLIRKTNENLSRDEMKLVRITVKYDPSSPPPLLVGYRLNAKPKCPDTGIIDVKDFKRPVGSTQRNDPAAEVAKEWPSPCPKEFTYIPESIKPGEWSGYLDVVPEEDGEGLWVRLTLHGQPIDITTDVGIIQYKLNPFVGAADYLIRKPNERLTISQTLRIKISVTYDVCKPIPVLVGYRLNARPICPESKIIEPETFVRPNIGSYQSLCNSNTLQNGGDHQETSSPKNDLQNASDLSDVDNPKEDGFDNLLKSIMYIEGFTSPCPELFRYDLNSIKPGEWSGTIILRPDEDLSGLWIRLTLHGIPDTVETDLGIINYKENSNENASDYLIRKTNEVVSVGKTKEIKITVKYNARNPPPLLVGYRVNAKPKCPDSGIIDVNEFKKTLRFKNNIDNSTVINDVEKLTNNDTILTDDLGTIDNGHNLDGNVPDVQTIPIDDTNNEFNTNDMVVDINETVRGNEDNVLKSPCPGVFTYEPIIEEDKWYGIVRWSPENTLNRITISIILDKPGVQLGNWFSPVTTTDNVQYKLEKTNVFPPKELITVRFFIKINPESKSFPRLKDVLIDGVSVCTKSPETVFSNDFITITKHAGFTQIKILNRPSKKTPIILV